MSQILKEIADISFFGNLQQKERALYNHLNGRHEFTTYLTSANHADPLTEYQTRMINDPSIPFKDMSFLYNVKTRRTESLLGVFMAMLKSAATGEDVDLEQVDGFKDITGALQTIEAGSGTNFRVSRTTADEDVGIAVGTGTTAVTMADSSLETKIVNGTSSGQLQYGSTLVSAMLLSSTEASYRISRSMGNATGSTITVEEVGLQMRSGTDAGNKEFLVERTINQSAVLDAENLVEAYSFKITT